MQANIDSLHPVSQTRVEISKRCLLTLGKKANMHISQHVELFLLVIVNKFILQSVYGHLSHPTNLVLMGEKRAEYKAANTDI